MNIIKKVRGATASPESNAPAMDEPAPVQPNANNEPDAEAGLDKPEDPDSLKDMVAADAQHGVQAVEATALAWKKSTLAAIFVL